MQILNTDPPGRTDPEPAETKRLPRRALVMRILKLQLEYRRLETQTDIHSHTQRQAVLLELGRLKQAYVEQAELRRTKCLTCQQEIALPATATSTEMRTARRDHCAG